MSTAAVMMPARPTHIKLYEATAELDTVREFLLEAEGEFTPEIEELLAHAYGTFDEKAERVAMMVRELEAESATQIAQAKAIAEAAVAPHARAAKAAENAAARLKAYLVHEMERAGRPKIEGLLKLSLTSNSTPSVKAPEFDEPQLRNLAMMFPDFVRRVPESFELDTDAIRTAWKINAAVDLPDGVEVTRGKHVRIR